MVRFLIGGSPCTNWSIANSRGGRETTASGIGWELFRNYLIAKEKFRPDFFLYENNTSAAPAIRDQIKEELQVDDGTLWTTGRAGRYIEINSALVSAQKRHRFYIHNMGEISQPEDRRIMLSDILESGITDREKAVCLLGTYDHAGARNYLKKNHSQMIFESVYPFGETGGKSFTLTATYYKGSNIRQTIARHDRSLVAERIVSAGAAGRAEVQINGVCREWPVYEVSGGAVAYNGDLYKVNLPDGYYIIRKLTVKECCRLQTMPDDYCRAVSDTQAYKALGNGWTAEVIMHILKHAKVPQDEEITVLSLYDGIGTGRYCFDRLGYKNIRYYAYEIDRYPIQIATSNYPDIIECGDAFAVRETEWRLPE